MGEADHIGGTAAMSAFDGARNHEDPGLDVARLAAGGTIDVQIRRRSDWPDRAMTLIWRGFFVALGIAVAARVVLS